MVKLGALTRSNLPGTRVAKWFLILAFLNLPIVAFGMLWVLAFAHDWEVLSLVPVKLGDGTLYEHSAVYNFVWSPIAAWLIALVVMPAGYWALFAAHAAVLPLLGAELAIVTVLSLPFWIDAVNGNYFTFVAVSGVLAMRGSRAGSLAFLALACLMPRPIQIPLGAYLLWRRPDLRPPFLVMVAISVGAAAFSGYAGEWATALLSFGGEGRDHLGPTRFIGGAWFVIGVPLAIWLTVRGRVGWAGLAVTPYLLPQYLLAILWEVASSPTREDSTVPAPGDPQAPRLAEPSTIVR